MKTLRTLIVEPGMAPRVADIEDTLQAKQEAVGGLIEMVAPPIHTDDAVLIVNEEGKLIGLPFNRLIRLADGTPLDVVAGTFLILRAPEDSEDFNSLTDKQIEIYSQMYV